MKDILVLLVLLYAQTPKVDSDGNCLDPTNEYPLDGSDLCCKKCPPGQRLKQDCSDSSETVCEQCPAGQYMERQNYSPNCLSCNKCKAIKGLQFAQNCSSTTMSKCECQPGRYCVMGFDGQYCGECNKYKPCKAGYGVSVPGTANSDVKCQRCPDGTFSDTVSYTDPCRPHTNCKWKVAREGDAASDAVCEPEAFISNMRPPTSTKGPHIEAAFTSASAVTSTVLATSDAEAPRGLTNATPSISNLSSVPEAVFNHSTKSPPPSTVSDSKLAAVIAGVIGLMLLLIAIILLCICKSVRKKDTARFYPKIDANGNCETGDIIDQGCVGETQQTSFTITSPEQQCLLEKGEACSDQSQCSNNTETLTRTDDGSSYESIGPLQSTVALHNPHSALSEPMTLLSNAESVTPQPSIPMQSSSQPNSPQIISPVTTSPHVNVNITFHIGNGSGGTPSVMPADLIHPKLPFGEEESFSIPQQEAGKESLMSVQESEGNST